jgi:hypothetical protein
MDISGRLLRLEESNWSALEDTGDDTCFAVRNDFVVMVLRFAGLGGCGVFVTTSREGSRVELVVFEKISVYRFCTWLGERKISSSESWISSTSINDGCVLCPVFEAFCVLFFGVDIAAGSARLAVVFDVDAVVLCLDFASPFGLDIVVSVMVWTAVASGCF